MVRSKPPKPLHVSPLPGELRPAAEAVRQAIVPQPNRGAFNRYVFIEGLKAVAAEYQVEIVPLLEGVQP